MSPTLYKKPATALKKAKAALNEVTAIIINKTNKTAMHKTFLADLSKDSHFTFAPDAPVEGLEVTDDEYKKYVYDLPKGEATHYNPSFWQFDLKLALWFSRHRLWALFFDWFKLRDKVVFPVGFLYYEGVSKPITPTRPKYDYALENWNIRHNTVFEKRLKKVGAKINRDQQNPTKWALIIGAIIIIIVLGIVMLNFMNGNADTTPIQNVTQPSPTPIIIR